MEALDCELVVEDEEEGGEMTGVEGCVEGVDKGVRTAPPILRPNKASGDAMD